MFSKTSLFAAACTGILAVQSAAAPVTFDMGNANTANNSQNGGDGNWTPFADEVTAISTSASTTIGGLEMTISGVANGGGDDVWGINNQGVGVHSDGESGGPSRRIDGTIGEAVVFSFDQDVTLTSVRLGAFRGDDVTAEVVTITPDGGSAIEISKLDSTSEPTTDWALGGVFVAAGTQITLTTTQVSAIDGGGGVLFNEITVDAVPEPGSLALLGLGGLMIARRRRS